MVKASETQYALTEDGAHIAYQVLGDGPRDLLCVGYGNFIPIDMRDDEPHFGAFEERLASFSRFIRYDPRGVGLSDPVGAASDLAIEIATTDAVTVLDAAGSERAALLATGSSGLTSLTVAATHPERVSSLLLVNCYARLERADDYPAGIPNEILEAFVADVLGDDKAPGEVDDAGLLSPSLARDPAYRAWWRRAGQRGASPSSARTLLPAAVRGDVRSRLDEIDCFTLVVLRTENRFVVPAHGRFLADHIAGAQLVELPGEDHLPFSGDADAVVDEIEEFLTGSRAGTDAHRTVMTILFTDIVGSTEQAERLGDRSWRLLLDRHDEMVRRQLRRFRGREVKTTGDGVLATFDNPTSGMRCARAILDEADQLDLQLRAGLHSGEVELRGDDVSGIAVHIAQRVSSMAGANEVLVSRTVADLVTGSAFEFEDRGDHPLKGVAGTWRLFLVRP
jgi:class 3 adenylate cyclase/pimeloyl-ACP methyl ester carboxylesterase